MNHLYHVFRLCSRFLLLFVFTVQLYSQQVSLSGYARDGMSRLAISSASVTVRETGQTAKTTDSGAFSIPSLLPGRYTIHLHHFAYADADFSVTLPCDTLRVNLQPALFQSDAMIVTSTRTSTVLTNTPLAIDVSAVAEITRSSPMTASEALAKIPGVALMRDGVWETAVSIRGMSRSNVVALVDNTRIETASDISGALSLINMNDLERIETIKGGGSTLYGTGALGGVIQFVTRRPACSADGSTTAELTSGVTSVNGGFSNYAAVEHSANRYALRISGGNRKAGNTETPTGTLPNSQFEDFSVSATLCVRPITDHLFYASYQKVEAENTGIPGGAPFAAAAIARYTLARRELFALEYSIPNLAPSVASVTMRASWQEIARNVELVQSPIVTVTPHATHITHSAQLEARLLPLDYNVLAIGVDGWERELDSRRERHISGKVIGERPVPNSTFRSIGVYAQDEWTLLPQRLTFTGGARYDWIAVHNDLALNPEYLDSAGVRYTAPAVQRILWNATDVANHSWSANAGAHYALLPQFDLTALVSTAFRSPSLEERYQFIDLGSSVQIGNPNLQPERSLSFNVGVRVHPEGTKIRGDVFLNSLTDLVTDVAGTYQGRAALIKQNIGEAKLYGYEIQVEQILEPWAVFDGSVSYVRGEDTQHHANLPQIPPLIAHAGISFAVEQWGTVLLSSDIMAAKNQNAAGESGTASAAIANIEVQAVPFILEYCSAAMRCGVQNILDARYRNALSTMRGTIKDEPGRNFFLSATLTF